eukprot:CCRYP_003775-RA/>CCRYP_003775-RA protein AED:0.48 eAED:0.48 QI:0/-1/0/1/-1/0/1/0/40
MPVICSQKNSKMPHIFAAAVIPSWYLNPTSLTTTTASPNT